MLHQESETKKFISSIATQMESSHYGTLPGDYITEAYIGEALGGRVDEGFIDVVKNIGRGITYPIEQVKNFWKHDREFISEVAKAEKSFPRETIAAIYSVEFADTNIVEDLWDMLCMLKDVILFRYQHLPWRTAVSAAGLALYYFSPWNLTLGTAIVKWLEGGVGNSANPARGSITGNGNTETGMKDVEAPTKDGNIASDKTPSVTNTTDSVPNKSWKPIGDGMYKGEVAPDGHEPIYANDNGKWIDINQPAEAKPALAIDATGVKDRDTGKSFGNSLPTNNQDVNVDSDGSIKVQVGDWSEDNEGYKVGESYEYNGRRGKCVDMDAMYHPSTKDIVYNIPGLDLNNDGEVDVWITPDKQTLDAHLPELKTESITAITAIGAATAAGAGIMYYHAKKPQIIAGLKVAEPYLNHLDELLIVFLLWKWFKKDLRDYRKWLAAKELVKDRKERGLNSMK